MNKSISNLVLIGMLVLLVSACAPAQVAEPGDAPSDSTVGGQYIGLTYPPLPAGVTEQLSMLIQDAEGYGLWLVDDGTDKMLWLGKVTSSTSSGAAEWVVKDVLALSKLGAGLVLNPDACSLNDAIDTEIIALAQNDTIRYAWRANTATEKFESLPTEGIRCNSDKLISLDQ